MVNKKILSILLVSLLLIIMSGCGGGGGVSGEGSAGSSATLMSISITPTNPTIAKNTFENLTATGIYSDNTTQDLTASVTWSSSDTNIATTSGVASTSPDTTATQLNSSNGKAYAYGKNAGKTTITATSGDTSGSTTITVTNATLVSLAVTPANPSIAKGSNQQFTATGTFSDSTTQNLSAQVAWSSSTTSVATIGTSGSAAAIAVGSTTIAALSTLSGNISSSTMLTVTTGSATLAWNAPTTNTDGTPLTDLAGYKIYYGTSSGNYTSSVNIGNVTSYTITNLSSGTYFFAMTTYDTSGIESSFSNELSKTIQ